MEGGGDNVVPIGAAIDKAAFGAAAKAARKKGPPPPPPPPPPGGRHVPPPILPHDAPVKALGVNGREFYFVNCRDQFLSLTDKDIGRLAIIGMFGGTAYLHRDLAEIRSQRQARHQFRPRQDRRGADPVLQRQGHLEPGRKRARRRHLGGADGGRRFAAGHALRR
jgi:hypothetical protein